MDDEECTYQALQEPLYRVETGNYEYRLILRCRQDARKKFGRLRSDLLEKLELLDQKHVQDIVSQLQRMMSAFEKLHFESHSLVKNNFISPIELDLSQGCTFTYQDLIVNTGHDDEEEEKCEQAEEAIPSLLKDLELEDPVPKSKRNSSDLDLLNLN